VFLLLVEPQVDQSAGHLRQCRSQLDGRLALVDPRFSEARWVGEVKSDTTSADPRVLTAALARSLADLIVSR
jgi:hypothetical protein